MGLDLLAVVDGTKTRGLVARNINSTFITFILKCSNPLSFNDFQLTSLRNLAYKVITKIVVNILKHGRSEGIAREEFGFIFNRKILDAIGTTQEDTHSINTKNILALVLKLDIEKDYDPVDLTFWRLVILQIGLSLSVTNWIMGCIISANFVFLVNNIYKFLESIKRD